MFAFCFVLWCVGSKFKVPVYNESQSNNQSIIEASVHISFTEENKNQSEGALAEEVSVWQMLSVCCSWT